MVLNNATGAFAALVIISAYLGFTSYEVPAVNDKALHFIAFFLLTVSIILVKDTDLVLITFTAYNLLGSRSSQAHPS